MRQCVIHFGHPKTATTYLQHCLHLNEALFARHNYWVPSEFRQFGLYDLEPMSRRGDIISGNLAPLHVLLTDGPGDLIPEMERYVFGAPGMPPDCDILLSSELFFYYWNSVVELVRTAERYGFAVKLIAYLPRQDRAAITGYLQNVRYHGFSNGVIDFLVHDRNVPYFRYMLLMRKMLKHVPGTPIILRTFDRQFLVDGDVFTDFMAAVECRVDPMLCERPVRISNQGLLLEQYELLRAATILGQARAADRLRTAETSLTPEDRARIMAYYYRPAVQDFLTGGYLAGNTALLDRFMPQASAAERAYWSSFDEAPAAVTLDPAISHSLWLRAFQ